MLIIKSDNIVYGVKYEIHKAELPWGIVDVHCAHNGIFPVYGCGNKFFSLENI